MKSNGFTQPIDDMGPHNPPSHPELVDYLAGEVRDGQYDLKDLICWITLSEAYSLSSRMTRHNEQDDPKRGQAPFLSSAVAWYRFGLFYFPAPRHRDPKEAKAMPGHRTPKPATLSSTA